VNANADAPIDMTVLPRTTVVDAAGRCSIGGVDLEALAEEFGTPLFVYDEDDIRTRCRAYVDAFGPESVSFAGKSFLCLALVRLLDEEGLHLDVASGGELAVALQGGMPATRLVFHGNNKSSAELQAAIESGVGRIVIDSADELDRIEALVADGRPAPTVLLRVTPGIDAHTHEAIATGVEDTKFGFSIASGAALAIARRAAASPAVELVGIHCHIGSQIDDMVAYERTAEIMVSFARAIEVETGSTIREIDLGGGLGIAYRGGDPAPAVAAYASRLRAAFDAALATGPLTSTPRLIVEPGRSIIGAAGVTLYRVGTIKDLPGIRTYIAIDGGMSDNARPGLYGAVYDTFIATRANAPRPRRVTIAGKHCEQGDLLVRDAQVPADVAVGDLLVTPATGAYGYAMASNYNKVPRPAVVFVRDGHARLVVRRETEADLTRLDV
jgi:diaminopimelate decarboxylase